MTWTYTDPTASSKDEIRYLVGDTDTSCQLVTDEEINFVLGIRPKVTGRINYQAAAEVADGIASKFGRRIQNSTGPISKSSQMQYDHYVDIARRMRQLASSGGLANGSAAVPVLGGGGSTYLGSNWGNSAPSRY